MSESQAQSLEYFLNLAGPGYLVSMYLITWNFRDMFISRFCENFIFWITLISRVLEHLNSHFIGKVF